MIYIYSKSFFPRKTFGFEADQEDEISDEDEDDGLDENDSDCHTIRVSKKEKSKDPIALDNGFFFAKFPQRKIMILRNLDDFADPNFDSSRTMVFEHNRLIRPCLIGRKFSVFSIQTFQKQGKHV